MGIYRNKPNKCLRQFPDCPETGFSEECNKCPFDPREKIPEKEIVINKLVDEETEPDNKSFKNSLLKLRSKNADN